MRPFLLLCIMLFVSIAGFILSRNVEAVGNHSIFISLAQSAPAPIEAYVGLFTIGELNQYDLYTARADGSEFQRLTTDMNAVAPQWSPDYSQILFESVLDERDLWLMNRDGTNQRRLTEGPGNPFEKNWSPDGSRISYVNIVDEQETLHIVTAATGEMEWQLDNSVINHYWAPNGNHLVLTIEYTETIPNQLSVYTINANGTNLTRITDPADNYTVLGWMQNGSRLLVQKYDRESQTSDLLLLNPDGSNPEVIYPNSETMYDIYIAPDGERFAYTTPSDSGIVLKTFTLGTSAPVAVSPVLCTIIPCGVGNIAWSPTSETLTFAYYEQLCPNCYYSSIYLTRADGSTIPARETPLFSGGTTSIWLDRTQVTVQDYTGLNGYFHPYIVNPATGTVLAEVLPGTNSRVYINAWQYAPH